MFDALHRYLGLALVVLAAAPASAVSGELRGTFSGTAYRATGFPASLDGSVVTGSFDISVGAASVIPNIAPYDYYVVYQNVTFDLTLNVPLGGSVVTYDFPYSFVAYGTASGTQQTILFGAEESPFVVYHQASLSLTGSNLLDFADPTNLMPGTIDYGFASLYDRPSAVNVSLMSVVFDAIPVPEPPAILVLVCGCAGLAALRIRGSARANTKSC